MKIHLRVILYENNNQKCSCFKVHSFVKTKKIKIHFQVVSLSRQREQCSEAKLNFKGKMWKSPGYFQN